MKKLLLNVERHKKALITPGSGKKATAANYPITSLIFSNAANSIQSSTDETTSQILTKVGGKVFL